MYWYIAILTGEYSKDFEEDNDISSDNDEVYIHF